MGLIKRLSLAINHALPIYIPAERRFTEDLHLAIWNCGNLADHRNLWQTLKDIRITLRKDYHPIFVIKKGFI